MTINRSNLVASCLVVLSTALGASSALGQMLADPSTVVDQGKMRVSGVFQASEMDYEIEDSTEDLERTIIGGEFAMGIASEVDFLGTLGFITDSEFDDLSEDGDGWTFGFGVRGVFHSDHQFKILGHGVFTYQKEEFDGDRAGRDWEIEMTTKELHVGATAVFAATPKVNPYGGLDIVIYSDGEIDAEVEGLGDDDWDVERDDMLGIKLGVDVNLASVVLRPEVTIGAEQTFTLAVAKTL